MRKFQLRVPGSTFEAEEVDDGPDLDERLYYTVQTIEPEPRELELYRDGVLAATMRKQPGRDTMWQAETNLPGTRAGSRRQWNVNLLQMRGAVIEVVQQLRALGECL